MFRNRAVAAQPLAVSLALLRVFCYTVAPASSACRDVLQFRLQLRSFCYILSTTLGFFSFLPFQLSTSENPAGAPGWAASGGFVKRAFLPSLPVSVKPPLTTWSPSSRRSALYSRGRIIAPALPTWSH